jgi:hypothetical protein
MATGVLAQDIGISGTLNTLTNQAGYKVVQGQTFIDTLTGEIIALVLGFVGALFLGFIVYSGFQWMSAGGNEEVVSKAKKRVASSIIGFGIIFFAFIISNAVFKFFYVQSNRTPTTVQEENWLGNECDENSDCPASAPICAGDLLWKWCTCTEAACQQLVPPQHCYEPPLVSNYCSECNTNQHCIDAHGQGWECDGGVCVPISP